MEKYWKYWIFRAICRQFYNWYSNFYSYSFGIPFPSSAYSCYCWPTEGKMWQKNGQEQSKRRSLTIRHATSNNHWKRLLPAMTKLTSSETWRSCSTNSTSNSLLSCVLANNPSIIYTYPGGSILSIELGAEVIMPCGGNGPGIGGPWANGDPGGIPNWCPLKGWPDDEKCGLPPNGGPDEFGRPTNCGPLLEGEPNGLGPLNVVGPAEFDVGGKPGCGPGPGVEDPDGAGDAVYCGVDEPVGGPEYGPPAGEPAPTGGPWNGDCPW